MSSSFRQCSSSSIFDQFSSPLNDPSIEIPPPAPGSDLSPSHSSEDELGQMSLPSEDSSEEEVRRYCLVAAFLNVGTIEGEWLDQNFAVKHLHFQEESLRFTDSPPLKYSIWTTAWDNPLPAEIQMIYMKPGLNYPETKNEDSKRPLQSWEDSPTIYLFDLYFPDTSSVNPWVELVYLALFAFQKVNKVHELAIFFSQKSACKPAVHPPIPDDQECYEVLRVVDSFLRRNEGNLDEIIAFYTFVIVGYLDIREFPSETESETTIALLKFTETRLESVFNTGPAKKYKKKSVRGLCHYLEMNYVQGREEWLTVLQRVHITAGFKYKEKLKAELMRRNAFRNGCGVVKLLNSGLLAQEEAAEMIAKCHDLTVILQILKDVDATNSEAMVEAGSKAMEECLKREMCKEDLENVVEFVENRYEIAGKILIMTDIKARIAEFVEKSSSERREIMKLIARMNNDNRLRFLIEKVKIEKFAESLLAETNIPFSEIVRDLVVPRKLELLPLFAKWHSALSITLSLSESIVKIDTELTEISEEITEEMDSICLVAIGAIKSDQRCVWILDLVESFQSVQTVQFQREYEKWCIEEFATYDRQKRVYRTSVFSSMLKLLQMIGTRRGNEVSLYVTLVETLMKISGKLDDTDVEKRLLTAPGSEDCWKLLFQSWDLFPQSEYMHNLAEIMLRFAERIINNEITFGEVSKIEQMTADNQSQLCDFLSSASTLSKRPTTFTNRNLIQALDLAHDYSVKLQWIRQYFAFLRRMKFNIDAVESDLDNFVMKLDSVSLRAINIPPNFKPILDISQQLSAALDSGVYAYFLEIERTSSKFHAIAQLFSGKEMHEICLQAFAQMKAVFGIILHELEKAQIVKLVSFFCLVPSIPQEITVLKEIFPSFGSHLVQIAESVTAYRERKFIVEVCVTLLNLLDRRMFSDDDIESDCKAFLAMETEEMLMVKYVEMHRNTERKLYGTREKDAVKPILSMFNDIRNYREMIEFVESLTQIQIDKLKDVANNFDTMHVNLSSILELEVIFKFIEALKLYAGSYEFFLDGCIDLLAESDYSDMSAKFENCNHCFVFIRSKISTVDDQKDAKMSQLKDITELSSFEVRLTEEGSEVRIKTSRQSLDVPEIEEIKDRTDLIRLRGEPMPEEENFPAFSRFVVTVKEVQKSIQNLREFGYPNDGQRLFSYNIQQGNFQNVEEYRTSLTHKISTWEAALRAAYSSNYNLTFFYGYQFWILEAYLIKQNQSLRRQSEFLLQFAGLSNVSPLSPLQSVPKTGSAETRLEYLSNFLRDFSRNRFELNEIFEEIPIEAKIDHISGGILYSESTNLLLAMLSVYINSSKKIPKAYQVLWCRKETVWGELMAFLYRCFTCQENSVIFSIVAGENLPIRLQSEFQKLFTELFNKRIGGLKFCLAVVTSNEHCLLSSFFKKSEMLQIRVLRESQLIRDADKIEKIVKIADPQTLVLLSNIAGGGKSSWIKRKAKELQREILAISLTGDVNLSDFCQKLVGDMTEAHILHLKVGVVTTPEVVNDIITSLSLFRTIICEETVISFRYCLIYIEVANMQPKLVTQIPFLGYLTTHELTFSLQEIIESPELKYVSMYLHLYDNEKLDTDDLTSFGYNPEMMKYVIQKYFVSRQESRQQPVSYRNLDTFLRVMSILINNFEAGIFTRHYLPSLVEELNSYGMQSLSEHCCHLRQCIMQGLLQSIEEVNTMSVSSMDAIHGNEYYRAVRYENGNHFLALFLSDGAFVPIYRRKEEVPEFIARLMFFQKGIEKQRKSWLPAFIQNRLLARQVERYSHELDNFSSMSDSELLAQLQTIFTSFTFAENQRIDGFSDYVMTSDNFVKMMLVYLRAMAKLPIVIMGETGCGKTYLIQFFVTYVLRNVLKVVNIHAGMTSSSLRLIMDDIYKLADTNSPRPIWVFFDEFNTSSCVGLLTEILCERQFDGKHIPDNVVLVAACNPYRRKPPALDQVGVGIQRKRRGLQHSQLVHRVNPLPESIIDYLWDFGALPDDEIKKYIFAMLSRMDVSKSLRATFQAMLFTAHSYFKEIDSSLVSLRDISRFLKLFRWFKESLRVRMVTVTDRYKQFFKGSNSELPWAKRTKKSEIAGVLAFCSCYLLRVSRNTDREELLKKVAEAGARFSPEQIQRILAQNEDDFLARLVLPPGLALNHSLRENVATIIECVFTRIPIFICGKPGCSKSLSVQLVLSNCKGKQSIDPYFRGLPELIAVPFQGSESCTGEGVEETFMRAQKENRDDVLPVVVFDEIGSAELSMHNPLKTLHSLLELEKMEVGFIGISNWKLDASKMNRVLYLARSDPSEPDLIRTALNLHEAEYGSTDQQKVIEALARAYSKFKINSANMPLADFYGLRDFYNLMKMVTRDGRNVKNGDRKGQESIVVNAIWRNFGGQDSGKTEMLRLFHEFLSPSPSLITPKPTLQLIIDNLTDPNARYLLLLSKGESGLFLLDTRLKATLQNYHILIGSQLPGDLNQEEYARQCLKHVILCMEQGIPVVFKGMNHVYSGLYDLFNQNFSMLGAKRYCNVALGAHFSPQRLVHPGFRAVVLVNDDEEAINETDAPFLNRFEKQQLSLESLSLNHQTTVLRLQDWIKRLTTLSPIVTSLLDIRTLFPLLSSEYLRLLAMHKGDERDCKAELIQTAPADLLVLAKFSILDEHEKTFIAEMWAQTHKESLSSVLSDHLQTATNPNLIVFAQSIEIIHCNSITGVHLCVRHFSAFNSEKDLMLDLASFYKDPNDPYYVIDFDISTQSMHLNWLKFALNKAAEEYWKKSDRKCVCLLVRIERNLTYSQEVWWFQDWNIAACDFLSDSRENMLEIIEKDTKTLILANDLVNFEKEFGEMLQDTFQKLDIRSNKLYFGTQIQLRKLFILANAQNSKQLISVFRRKVFDLIQNQTWTVENWKLAIFSNINCVKSGKTLKSAVIFSIKSEISKAVASVLFSVEKLLTFASFFEKIELLREIWIDCFEKMPITEILQPLTQSNCLNVNFFLDFPFSITEIRNLTSFFSISGDNLFSDEIDAYSDLLHFFRKQSQYRSKLHQINEIPEIHDIFLSDLIIYEFEGRFEGFPIRKLALELHKFVSPWAKDFETKVICYFRHRELIFEICKIFSILEGLIVGETLRTVLIELQDVRKSAIARPTTESEAVSPLLIQDTTLDLLSDLVQTWALKAQPNAFIFRQLNGLANYSMCLSELMQKLKNAANSFDLRLNQLEIIEFWSMISEFSCETKVNQESVLELAQRAKTYESEDSIFVYNRIFSDTILSFFDKVAQSATVHISRYRILFFGILLHKSPEIISKIAEEMESQTLNVCFSNIITKVIRLCNLDSLEYFIQRVVKGEDLDCEESQSYLARLEDTLTDLKITCNMGVVLSDLLVRNLEQSRNSESPMEYLEKFLPEFKEIQRAIETPHSSYPNIATLICLSALRVYMNHYAKILLEDIRSSDQCTQAIDEFLKTSLSLRSTLKLYISKIIKKIGQKSTRDLQDVLNIINTTHWKLDFSVQDESLPVPLGLGSSEMYQNCYYKLGNLLQQSCDRGDDLKCEIESIDGPGKRIEFVVACMMQLFTAHFHNRPVAQVDFWLRSVDLELEVKLGRELHKLLQLFKNNFPVGSILHVTPRMTQNSFAHAQMICLFLVVLLANSNVQNPMTSIFFGPNGELYSNIVERFNQLYIYGIESEPLYSELTYILSNFDNVKSDSWRAWKEKWVKGSAYKCSNTCDYLYFVPNCGAPMKKSVCPYCKAQIGGSNHIPIKRPGHENLSDDEAKAFLSLAISQYINREPSGYKAFGPDTLYQIPVREISMTGFKVLHMFVNASLYFLFVSKSLEEETMRKMVSFQSRVDNFHKYFRKIIENDLKTLGIPIGEDQQCLWLESVISHLILFLTPSQLPDSRIVRKTFEEYFDNSVISHRLTNPERIVSEYKEYCSRKELSWITLIEEISTKPESYPLYQLFRVTAEPNWDHFSRSFKIRNLSSTFRMLDVYIENRTEFEQLRCLIPLVKLTNHFSQRFNHAIARDEAKCRKIRDVLLGDERGKALFSKFSSVWNKIQLLSLQYGCKELPYRCFTDDDELCYFLPDNKELGGGLYATAAIVTLANVQNRLISQCGGDAVAEIPVQSMKKGQSFVIDISSLSQLLAYAMNNPEYGRGSEIIYDYTAIEGEIRKKLNSVKKLGNEQIALIQYQFELQNLDGEYSSLISEIRRVVRQEKPSRDIRVLVSTSLSRLSPHSSTAFQAELRLLSSSLDYLLCALKSYPGNTTIADLSQHLTAEKLHPILKDQQELANFPLKSIVWLYEYIEKRHFPYLREYIRREFHQKLSQAVLKSLLKSLISWEKQPDSLPLSLLRKALMRLISRCLTGYVRANLCIEMYISRPDFWPEEVNEETVMEVAGLLKEVELSFAMHLMDALDGVGTGST